MNETLDVASMQSVSPVVVTVCTGRPRVKAGCDHKRWRKFLAVQLPLCLLVAVLVLVSQHQVRENQTESLLQLQNHLRVGPASNGEFEPYTHSLETKYAASILERKSLQGFPLSELALVPKSQTKVLEQALRKDFKSNLRLLNAAGGLDLSRVPHLDGTSQMLGGWAAEERLLDRLQKNAENNLAKDPAASDTDFIPETKTLANNNNSTKKDDLVLDDSGERIPEATLRAEAAALGYQDVTSWKRDFFASSLKNKPVKSGKHVVAKEVEQSKVVKPRPHVMKPQSRLQRRSIATDFLSNVGKFFGSFFKQDTGGESGGRVQELFHVERERNNGGGSQRMNGQAVSSGMGAQSLVADEVMGLFSTDSAADRTASTAFYSQSAKPLIWQDSAAVLRPQESRAAMAGQEEERQPMFASEGNRLYWDVRDQKQQVDAVGLAPRWARQAARAGSSAWMEPRGPEDKGWLASPGNDI